MGGVLSQPITDKSYNQGEGLGLRYGLCSMQGWRSEMEDAHDVRIGLKYGLEDWSYFAVFDGHAGKRAAAFAAWNLLEFILRDSQLKLQTKDLPDHVPIEPNLDKEAQKSEIDASSAKPNDQDVQSISEQNSTSDQAPSSTDFTEKSSTRDTSKDGENASEAVETNKQVSTSSQEGTNRMTQKTALKPELISLPVVEQLVSVKEAIRSGFLRIDESMRDANDLSGCTAVCALISPTHLFIANCGDSRAVLYDGIEPTFATEDHKPLNPKERVRIVNAGGCVSQRINGTLAVSRALGDFEFKKDQEKGPCEQLVSPEPEVTAIERGPTDEFLVLACDGIWDVMSNKELCEFIKYKLQVEPSVQNVCSSVLDLCLHRGSRDNMSIIIVVFENGPQFDQAMRDEEEKSDKALVEVARSIDMETYTEWLDFIERVRCIVHYDRPDIKLPPGGGFEAHFDMLHKIFEKQRVKIYASGSEDEDEVEEANK